MPASGSIHSQPKARGQHSPTITSTETAASAMTWTMAARMLLSRRGDAVRVLVLLEDDGIILLPRSAHGP